MGPQRLIVLKRKFAIDKVRADSIVWRKILRTSLKLLVAPDAARFDVIDSRHWKILFSLFAW